MFVLLVSFGCTNLFKLVCMVLLVAVLIFSVMIFLDFWFFVLVVLFFPLFLAHFGNAQVFNAFCMCFKKESGNTCLTDVYLLVLNCPQ